MPRARADTLRSPPLRAGEGSIVTEPGTSEPDGICTECGICCTGALFDQARILGHERERLAGLGFTLVEEPGAPAGAEVFFAFPCHALNGTICTVYEDRPTKCAEFRCELLRAYDDGSIGRDDAMERVMTAKSMLARIAGLLPQGWTLPEARRRWRRRMTGSAEDLPGELMMQMSLLNIFFDRYFYKETKRQMDRR